VEHQDLIAGVDAAFTFRQWLETFRGPFESGDAGGLAGLFIDDAYWKDFLTFNWTFQTVAGSALIAGCLSSRNAAARPRGVRPSSRRTPPRTVRRSGKTVVEAFFEFDTAAGHATGFVRLLSEPGSAGPQAWLLLTALQELHGFEENTGQRRPKGVEYSRNETLDNWLDRRNKELAYADRDPEAVIIGGGQAGLILATRLRQMNVDVLILERTPRVGDVWRERYHSLTLHNEVWANSLPYIDFPPTWPAFLPKDKLAEWLESYAKFMELNVWTGCEVVSASYSEGQDAWAIEFRDPDSKTRTIRAQHVVLATGSVSGVPNRPHIDGLENYSGQVLHSSEFTSAENYREKNVVVFGTGNSGHDIAQELHNHGARAVSIVQQGPTCVLSLEPSGTLAYSIYGEGLPVDDVDLITAAIPYPLLLETHRWLTGRMTELDGDLLARLHGAGFETTNGPDDTGFYVMHLRRGGGYYIDVGCSELIAAGKINLLKSRAIESFSQESIIFRNGSRVECDTIILATGFLNQQEGIRKIFGDSVAECVGPVWGFDEEHVMRNMWRRTAQAGLWVMGGSLIDCRLYSRYLALQIKAELENIQVPDASAGG
jgi:glycine/D-amino acid oxidase-like deaminating enzyme